MREQENTFGGVVSVRWRAAAKLSVAQLKRATMQDLIISLPKETYCFEMWMNST